MAVSPIYSTGLTAEAPVASVANYISLLKPRVMSLVLFTAAMTLMAAPHSLHPVQIFMILFSIALGAGASGAFNMWYERALDAKMERTRHRPLVRRVIPASDALFFSLACGAFSLMFLSMASNWLAAFWLLVAMVIYGFVYTVWLKPRTPQNIVIGGASGALPPVIVWAAAMGATPVEAWALFAIIFLWTPPHFWALSLYKWQEYKQAGIPMMPVVKGVAYTKKQILLYIPVVIAASLLPLWFGLGGYVYATVSIVMGIGFYYFGRKAAFDATDKSAKQLFGFSMLYLFSLFLTLGCDVWLSRIL
jgi:protoheme IX farnesyltransferase